MNHLSGTISGSPNLDFSFKQWWKRLPEVGFFMEVTSGRKFPYSAPSLF